jgi:hypothetical protein
VKTLEIQLFRIYAEYKSDGIELSSFIDTIY